MAVLPSIYLKNIDEESRLDLLFMGKDLLQWFQLRILFSHLKKIRDKAPTSGPSPDPAMFILYALESRID